MCVQHALNILIHTQSHCGHQEMFMKIFRETVFPLKHSQPVSGHLEHFIHVIVLPGPASSYYLHIIGVMNGCESPCECWESNTGPLQEQQVRLTARLSLQPSTGPS